MSWRVVVCCLISFNILVADDKVPSSDESRARLFFQHFYKQNNLENISVFDWLLTADFMTKVFQKPKDYHNIWTIIYSWDRDFFSICLSLARSTFRNKRLSEDVERSVQLKIDQITGLGESSPPSSPRLKRIKKKSRNKYKRRSSSSPRLRVRPVRPSTPKSQSLTGVLPKVGKVFPRPTTPRPVSRRGSFGSLPKL